MARLRSHGFYSIEPLLVQRDGYFEARIFLGAYRWDQAAHLMRLIRVGYRGQWYSSIPTISDPCQWSGAQIVALSARRGDIELGFRMLKEHLGLRFLWSAKMQVIGAHLWATVILAQILHALQVQVAIESGGETFDVSLEVLWRSLPALSQLWATPCLRSSKRSESLSSSSDPRRAFGEWFPTLTGKSFLLFPST